MSIAMPHFDAEKVFGLFTEAEAQRARKLMKEQKAGAVRSMIVAAMRRAEHMPLASFVSHKRERIVVEGRGRPAAPYENTVSHDQEGGSPIIHEMGQ